MWQVHVLCILPWAICKVLYFLWQKVALQIKSQLTKTEEALFPHIMVPNLSVGWGLGILGYLFLCSLIYLFSAFSIAFKASGHSVNIC